MVRFRGLTLPPLGKAKSKRGWLKLVAEQAKPCGVILQPGELEQLWEDAADVAVHLSGYLDNAGYYNDPCYGCYKEDHCEIHDVIVYDQFEEECDCWFGATPQERLESVVAAHIFAALLCQRYQELARAAENNERGQTAC